MSAYTTQLRYPIIQFLKDINEEPIEENWYKIFDKLGLNDYPIFDENYRKELNYKIIRHYYMREIGAETFGLFKFYLRRTMFEIMPYYNQLYNSQLIEISDPLNDIDMHYDDIWENEGTGNNSNSGSSNSRNVYQDTPMSLLTNDPQHDPTIQGMDYATNVTYDTQSAQAQGTNHNVADGTDSKHEYGHRQTQQELLMKLRESFLNIDMDIIKDLEVCFFRLW